MQWRQIFSVWQFSWDRSKTYCILTIVVPLFCENFFFNIVFQFVIMQKKNWFQFQSFVYKCYNCFLSQDNNKKKVYITKDHSENYYLLIRPHSMNFIMFKITIGKKQTISSRNDYWCRLHRWSSAACKYTTSSQISAVYPRTGSKKHWSLSDLG